MSYSSDEGSQLLSSFSFQADLLSDELSRRLQLAWTLVSFYYPTVVTRLFGPEDSDGESNRYLEYREVDHLALAEQRAERTFFPHIEEKLTNEELRAALSGRKIEPEEGETDTHLHFIFSNTNSEPHSLLLHARHAMYDTISVCWLIGKILELCGREPYHLEKELKQLSWEKSVENLPPHHLDSSVWEPKGGSIDVQDIKQGLADVFHHFGRVGVSAYSPPYFTFSHSTFSQSNKDFRFHPVPSITVLLLLDPERYDSSIHLIANAIRSCYNHVPLLVSL